MKEEPGPAVAVSVTWEDAAKFAKQAKPPAPQLIPDVLLVTAPPPDPAVDTANANDGVAVKAAVTD
jgi:hypothetical protein